MWMIFRCRVTEKAPAYLREVALKDDGNLSMVMQFRLLPVLPASARIKCTKPWR